jgi:hypothetical protein
MANKKKECVKGLKGKKGRRAAPNPPEPLMLDHKYPSTLDLQVQRSQNLQSKHRGSH